ncbi:MAG: prolipoprotein diacylglyceryl transferase [Deltaproteobacteria bacterium]|jgi:phosphatidylglycerol:prolipoprotein diacylglycerol transferase|nr:prolipoprotein diacylglyceryl transferase [Deltaproteobacteria bacterium]MBW2531357.1 prolipoprotein diacylglyceryl transferase [Deltaproteobacteria bacterium]
MHPIMFRIPLGGISLPVLGDVGDIPIYSYGVMLGLSLVVGWYLTLGLAERDGLPRETMANNYVVTAIAAVVFSRVLYILTNLDEFDSFGDIFSLRQGGLVAYGGFIGGYLGSWAYLKKKRIRLMPWADVAVPSLASGLMITRIGCYLYGCDYGKPLAEGAPGFLKTVGTFPRWPEGTLPQGTGAPAWWEHHQAGLVPPDATASLPVHPTQIYESLVGAGLLALLLLARRRQRFRGQIFFVFAFAYGTILFLLELLRADPERGSVPPSLPEHVLIPLCLLIFAIAYTVSFAQMIEHPAVRKATQVLSFVPAVGMYLSLRPESFAGAMLIQLSTSQFIGLATGVAVAVAFVIFHRAALAHPESAMALDLPVGLDEPEPDEEEERPRKRRRRRRAGDGDDEAADRAARRKRRRRRKRKEEAEEEDEKAEPEADEEPDEGASDDEADEAEADSDDSDAEDEAKDEADSNDDDEEPSSKR